MAIYYMNISFSSAYPPMRLYQPRTASAMTLKHYVKGRPQKLNAAKTVSMLYGLPGSSAM